MLILPIRIQSKNLVFIFFLLSITIGVNAKTKAIEVTVDASKREVTQPPEVLSGDILTQIDQAFLELNPEKALELTESALKYQPNNPEVLWRHSRALVSTAEGLQNKEAKLAAYEQARNFAENVISAQPNLMGGYIRRAIACGKIALFKGVLETRELVTQMKNDAEKAISLNSGTPYDLALAHYLLGRVHLKLSETPKLVRLPLQLAWGNLQDAEKHLAKAVSLHPESPGFNIDYAAALIKLGNKAEAKTILTKAVTLKALDVSDIEKIEEAKALLKSL
jgi:tetratricopeptide (TPR) repeat protein